MEQKSKRVKANVDKCKSCGGEMKFCPTSLDLVCPSCGSSENFEKSTEIEKHDANKSVDNSSYKQWIKQNKFLKCDSCGAKVVLGKYDITQTCPYCGSTFIAQIDDLPGLKPDAVVPFEFDQEEASARFKTNIKKKFFVPNNFKKDLPASKIHGVYVPVFVFDADSNSTYTGRVVDEEDVTSFGETRSIETGYPISGELQLNHRNIMVESSSYLSDYDMINLQPYDLNKAYKFNQGFIKGYSVEHYQETIDHCKNIARNKFREEIRSEIEDLHDEGKIENLNINSQYINEKYTYHLLPVYNFEYNYKNKKRMAHMNGQTGKVCGDLPVSVGKVSLIVGLGILGFLGLGFLIYKLIMGV